MLFANALADALGQYPAIPTDQSELMRQKTLMKESIPYPELIPLVNWKMDDEGQIDARLHVNHEGVCFSMVGYLINGKTPKWAYVKNITVGTFETEFRKAFAAGYRFAKEHEEALKNDQP